MAPNGFDGGGKQRFRYTKVGGRQVTIHKLSQQKANRESLTKTRWNEEHNHVKRMRFLAPHPATRHKQTMATSRGFKEVPSEFRERIEAQEETWVTSISRHNYRTRRLCFSVVDVARWVVLKTLITNVRKWRDEPPNRCCRTPWQLSIELEQRSLERWA